MSTDFDIRRGSAGGAPKKSIVMKCVMSEPFLHGIDLFLASPLTGLHGVKRTKQKIRRERNVSGTPCKEGRQSVRLPGLDNNLIDPTTVRTGREREF